MASEIEIINMGLVMVGAARIANRNDASKQARAVDACYDTLRQAELRRYVWSFAIKRTTLAPLGTDPEFGPSTAYQLPSDFLRLAPRDHMHNIALRDWVIEGRTIVTNFADSLELRYVKDETVANTMDPLFRVALSARIGWHVCEEITGNATKRQLCEKEYEKAVAEARRIGAIEKPPQDPAVDDWTLTRGQGVDYSRGWA